jgi:hypothetical protein
MSQRCGYGLTTDQTFGLAPEPCSRRRSVLPSCTPAPLSFLPGQRKLECCQPSEPESTMSLDSFITASSTRPSPTLLASSQEIRDRASLFVAHLFRACSLNDARAAQQYAARLHKSSTKPSHAMYAWRAMVLRPGRTGLDGEEDFTLEEGKEDDGEKWGGERILRVMKEEGMLDAVIVVLRWYV